MSTKPHYFNVENAKKYGVEKAVLLYNITHWLDKEFANAESKNSKSKIEQHTDGKSYVWTYNSARAFLMQFPYMTERTISRHLKELEDDGALISGNFNKFKYDKTKWYTMAEFEVTNLADPSAKMADGQDKLSDRCTNNGQPIPDINTDINTDKSIYHSETLLSVPQVLKNNLIDQLPIVTKPVKPIGKNSQRSEIQSKKKSNRNKELTDEEKNLNDKIMKVLVKFNEKNPGVGYGNRTHRSSIKTLLERYNVDQIGVMIDTVFKVNGMDYAPIITTPHELLTKLSKLELYLDKNKVF